MESIIRLLRRHEGVEPYAYKDHLGYITVGVGRCLEKDVGMGLSDDEIDYLLKNDIVRVQPWQKKTMRQLLMNLWTVSGAAK